MKIRNLLVAGAMALVVLGATGVAQAGDVRMFARHEVADYSAWKKTYDTLKTMQKKGGVFHKEVFQSTEDPNDITVIHDFHSLEQAKAFAGSAELKAAMEKAGVKGAPQIWFANRPGK